MLDSFTRQNVIGRLRVVGTNVDALSARLRATILLNASNLEAAQPTPSAIVFIRKLRDPLPGVLSLDSSATEPPMEWKTALAGTLRSVAGRAGRPAVEAVNGNEEAIIFADRAELLACLAADTCHGTTATRWWWSCLLRAGHDLHAIKKIWRESPEYIPAALHHLSRRHLAAAFVQRFDDDTAHQFVQAITQVFGLQWLMPAVAARMVAIGSSRFGSSPATATSEELSNVPPWLTQATEAGTHQLSLEQQRFLGIALMIQRAPTAVRTRDFARALEQWQEQLVVRAANQLLPSSTRPRVSQPQTLQQTLSSSPDVQSSSDPAFQIEDFDESRVQTPKPPAVETLASLTATESPESISPEVVAGPLPESAHAIIDNVEQSEPIGPDPAPAVHSLTTAALTDPSTIEARNFDDDTTVISIETDLGGLLYLINLGVYLNLYSDFTSPLAPGIELNIWDFVALVGSELVEGAQGDDPIWAALANLAGRDETQPPGTNFEPENEWRLPPEWLLPFKGDKPCKWETRRHRLRVLHPEGFLILDLPLAEDTHAQMQHEISPYRISIDTSSRARLPRSALGPGPTVDRWLSLLMPYVRARLRVALGLKANDEIWRFSAGNVQEFAELTRTSMFTSAWRTCLWRFALPDSIEIQAGSLRRAGSFRSISIRRAMRKNLFEGLEVTPAEHFKLCFYGAVLSVFHHVVQLFGSAEAAFKEFPFLIGYNNELADGGLAGVNSGKAVSLWLESLREWEKKAAEHLPARAGGRRRGRAGRDPAAGARGRDARRVALAPPIPNVEIPAPGEANLLVHLLATRSRATSPTPRSASPCSGCRSPPRWRCGPAAQRRRSASAAGGSRSRTGWRPTRSWSSKATSSRCCGWRRGHVLERARQPAPPPRLGLTLTVTSDVGWRRSSARSTSTRRRAVPRRHHRAPAGTADVVVRPRHGRRGRAVVRAAPPSRALPVTPVVAGYNVAGIAIPRDGGIVLDLTRMDRDRRGRPRRHVRAWSSRASRSGS